MLREVPYRASVLKDDPAYAARGFATDADKIRWVRGWPQARGGETSASDDTLDGVCRGGHVYTTSAGRKWGVLGTHTRAYAYSGSRAWNITPIRSYATLGTDPFTTTAGGGAGQTVSVSVAHTAHGAAEGDTVLIRGSATFDNLTPGGANGTLSASPFTTISGRRLVVVSHTSHGLSTGDIARYSSATAVGGITIGGTSSGTYATDPFVVTADSVMITVTHTSHGYEDGEVVTIAGSAAVGGITPSGDYVLKVADANTYVIAHTSQATSSATGGGGSATYSVERSYGVHVEDDDNYLIEHVSEATSSATGGGTPGYEYAKMHKITGITDANNYTIDVVATGAQSGTTGGGSSVDVDYEITIGLENTAGSGFGAGGYGSGPFGISESPSAYPQARTWAIDDRIDFAYLNPVDGTIYEWTANASRRAQALQNAPAQVRYMIITDEYNVMAFGCTNDESNFRPTLMRHSCSVNVECWYPAASNTSGSLGPIGGGNAFVVAKNSKNGILAWTERSLHAFRYTRDQDDLYAQKKVGTGCGALGPNAVIDDDGSSYWITPQKSFYIYTGGGPQEVPSPCRKWFEDTLAEGQGAKVWGTIDNFYHAVEWFFPATADGDCDTYIRWDLQEGGGIMGWSPGTWDRSVWIDNIVFDKPLAVSPTGSLYFQEDGLGDNGGAVTRFVEYAPIDIADGAVLQQVSKMVLSMERGSNTAVDVTLKAKQWPDNTEESKGPFTVRNTSYPDSSSNSAVIDSEFECRQLGMRIESTGSEDYWRLANVRYDRGVGAKR